jgi:DNA-binding NarL/FixJ family response regulator
MTVRDQVAARVADGDTDKQIATALRIEVETVRYHIRRLCAEWAIDRTRNIRVQITRRLLAA